MSESINPLYDVPSSPPPPSPRNSPDPPILPLLPADQPNSDTVFEWLSPTPRQSLTPATGNSSPSGASAHKRPAEDMTQFAEATAHNVKLCPDNCRALLDFSKVRPQNTASHYVDHPLHELNAAEQLITLSATLMKILECQNELVPAEAVYNISENITKYIDTETTTILAHPDLVAYVHDDAPVIILEAQLKAKNKWNLSELKDDRVKWEVIIKYSRTKFNNKRHTIKKALGDSLGGRGPNAKPAQDIIDLCIATNTQLNGGKLAKAAKPRAPTVAMLERVTFLSFWEYVDNELSTVRTFHKDDAKKISKMFAQILEND
ncbi:hypothetical protein SCP_1301170 [Sparassis crispa]|uniref:Uncharacterized protein n=1 Tax=Sparassis crispa TaxID=139825 RepID=A0A401H1N3_9APHY|nr:hypothetical protein SCP_1301170 [Sparassis crispa]GBE88302.1 hypothetical protein SCP_1301170 [Sparassis crispa]